MASRCRLCLCILPENDEKTQITDEYGKVAEESPIVNKIKAILQLKLDVPGNVNRVLAFPHFVCVQCTNQLDFCAQFIDRAQVIDLELKRTHNSKGKTLEDVQTSFRDKCI